MERESTMGQIKTQTRFIEQAKTRNRYKLAHWANELTRNIPTITGTQTTTSYRSGKGEENYVQYYLPNQYIVSENDHLASPQGSSDGQYLFPRVRTSFDNGHEFDTILERTIYSHPRYSCSNGARTAYYKDGPLVIDKTLVPWQGSVPAWPRNEANVVGSRFIRDSIPTRPSSQLAISLGEIFTEGKLPSLIGGTLMSDKLNAFRKAGSEYLNVTFGWLPFISDLTEILEAVVNSERIISQFVRDSGRIVRRKRRYPPEVEYFPVFVRSNNQLDFPVAGLRDAVSTDSTKRYGTLTSRQWTRTKYSFSAAYTYYLDTGGEFFSDLKRFEQLANKLLGTRLTPEVLWELVPFSWLIDWMSSTGIYISNYSSFNGDELVLKYGYVMRQKENWRQTVLTGISFDSGNPGIITETLSSIRKSRVKSTPYGFGLNTEAFSARQWAILAALGLTKAPSKLF